MEKAQFDPNEKRTVSHATTTPNIYIDQRCATIIQSSLTRASLLNALRAN